MDGAGQAGFSDLVERGQHGRMIDAREAHGVVLVGGKLERRHTRSRQSRDSVEAAGIQDCAVERHVDMGSRVHPSDLIGEDRRVGHGRRHLVGHVAAGRYPPRQQIARRFRCLPIR